MHSVTLDEIHRDPSILDRAIASHESMQIFVNGEIAGTLVPTADVGRRSERGFPISKGSVIFGSAQLRQIEAENEPQ